MIVAGIDPSLSKTAIVIGDDADDFDVFTFPSKPIGPSPAERVQRYDILVHSIMEVLRDLKPERIFIEGYAFGAKMAREVLGEFGGVLRWHLVDLDPLLTEVSPMGLKKFVTGKGAGQKEQMMLGVYRNWGYEPKGNDDADAYGLWRLGRCVCGLDEPSNQAQREAVQKVKGV